MKEILEWDRLLFNELPAIFLVEVLIRTAIMYLVILVALRSSGKRGVKQLSVYELVLIIGLGSAAGDPMFYEDVGLLPALIVFLTIIMLYRATTWLSSKNTRVERLLEGYAVCVIKEGRFSVKNFEKESLAQTEFFSELREKNVEHLGQVRIGLLEPSGEMSLFFYEDKDVQYGLPLIPDAFDKKHTNINSKAIYACAFCGQTKEIDRGKVECPECERDEWVKAINTRRIT
jgi:uncharacterized membrane protein YcaP (DUF421 family)